jgi:hypothetical protein
MISLISKIKIVSLLILLISVYGLGYYTHYKFNPTIKTPTIQQDIKPQTHSIITKPETPEQFVNAFNSPIIVSGKLTGQIYDILASDGFKETHKQDRIIIPVYTPKYILKPELYAGIIDRKPFYFIGVGASYFVNKKIVLDFGISGSPYGGMVHGSIGYVIY